ncbi:MAG TPA: hypothetical protein VKA84_04665 [Gemmatimonadaceae bacterium]|nr:hypothetical protein [Gemmatimonadaceae bacterium]
MRHRPHTAPALWAALAVTVVACTDVPAPQPVESPAASVLPRRAFDLAGADQARPCRAAPYRLFDFWLGNLMVVDAATGADLGHTNVVTRDLGGCAIQEHWTTAEGFRGRSLNAYDAADGRWHQHWVDDGFNDFTLEGDSPAPGTMVLSGGEMRTPAGVVTQRVTWTRMSSQRTRQLGEGSVDGGTTWTTQFDVLYDRRPQVTPAPAVENPFGCANFPRPHQFDFLLGTWEVRLTSAAGAGEPLAVTSVTTDLTHCLLEEQLTGAGGYEGRSFAAVNRLPLRWERTYVDNEGHRVFLAGGRQPDGSMVLAGTKRLAGGATVDLRVTWQPVTPDEVLQRWEISMDGGGTWAPELELTMRRR